MPPIFPPDPPEITPNSDKYQAETVSRAVQEVRQGTHFSRERQLRKEISNTETNPPPSDQRIKMLRMVIKH